LQHNWALLEWEYDFKCNKPAIEFINGRWRTIQKDEFIARNRKEFEMWANSREYPSADPRTRRQQLEQYVEEVVSREIAKMFPPEEVIVYDDLLPQVLSENQITVIKERCFELLSKHIPRLPTILKVLEDFVELCKLLCIPDNQVRVQSHQYIEREVPSRLVTDMLHEMEQELIDLPRFQAYAKFIQEQAGEQTTLKTKIATSPFIGGWGGYEYEDMLSFIKVSTAKDGFTRLRSDIEAEIIERQEPWINVSKGTGSKGRRKPPKGEGPQDDAPPSHS